LNAARLRQVGLAVAVVAAIAAMQYATRAHGTAITYMQIPGVTGPVTAAGHKGWIELDSWAFGASRVVSTGGGGGGGTGKAKFGEFNITKVTDATTPILFKHLVTGQPFKGDTLVAFLSGNPSRPYLVITLKNIVVSGHNISGSGGAPTETISLTYSGIDYCYTQQSATTNNCAQTGPFPSPSPSPSSSPSSSPSPSPSPSPTPTPNFFTEYTLPTSGAGPEYIRLGYDANLWFTENTANKIGRIITAGTITEFTITTANSKPVFITSGTATAAVNWFTESGAGQIATISGDGGVVHEFTITSPSNVMPYGIALDAGGNPWFTENAGDQIGDYTDGGTPQYPIPTTNSGPEVIVQDPVNTNNRLWFTEFNGGKIGAFSTATHQVTEFTITRGNPGPSSVAVNGDGRVWFTERTAGIIGVLDVTGPAPSITEFTITTPNSMPTDLALGPDGAFYFTEYGANKIGRITSAGGITEFTITTPNSAPYGIAAGPDNYMWFTEFNGNKIGKLGPIGSNGPGDRHHPLPRLLRRSRNH
jgi:virginiamycin B lyase